MSQTFKPRLDASDPLYVAVSNAWWLCPGNTESYQWISEAKMLVDGVNPVDARREAHWPPLPASSRRRFRFWK